MKNYLLLFLFTYTIFGCEQQKSDQIEPKFDSFKIKRGTNLSHWLSQSSRRGAEREAYITLDDIDYIRSLGFDHLRIHTFDELKIPEEDTNIVLSYHFYEPFLLTHYQASWTYLKNYKGPVQYPGELIPANSWNDISTDYQQRLENLKDKSYNKETLKKMMAKPFNKAEKTGLILFCGEFGVIANAPREDMLNWYRDIIDVFEENNVAYSNWDYKSGSFGLVNEQGEPDLELIDIVVGN